MSGLNLIAGIPIVANPHMPVTQKRQVRFPRSKKKRIRNKWAKSQTNFRDEAVVWLMSGAYHAHPTTFDSISKMQAGLIK
jgi:hypothetical protein